MTKLIAAVATAVLVDGVRTVIQPGQELPDLPDHDERELLASGSAKNPDDEAALQKTAERAQRQGEREFEEARTRVQASQASTQDAGKNAATAKSTNKPRK